MATLIHAGKGTITSAGGSAQAIQLKNVLSSRYFVSLKLLSGTPLAGTTTVFCTPSAGTREQVTSDGSAININPTALAAFEIGFPLSSIDFTPTSWTADVVVEVTVFCEA